MGESRQVSCLQVVLPGDLIMELPAKPVDESEKIYLGPGLRWKDGVVRATRPGVLKKDGRNLFFIESHQKRYIPQKREFVIGTVIKNKGNSYLVDIGSHEPAVISFLAFENASKKTRKDLKLGDLIYGQLLVANKDMEPELVCIDFYNRAVGMGTLPEGGLLFKVPLHVARSLLHPDNPYLLQIGSGLSFSIVVGFNGRVWVKGKDMSEMTAVMHAVMLLDCMSLNEALTKVHAVIDSVLALSASE
ncbi:K domain type 1 [Trinorchestia longiramus]|nr:K domain type 1 [Trinorchestia longiramus]